VGKNVSLHLKVFPNPTSDGRLVQVETGEAIEIYRMEIYDNRGRVVLSGKGNVDKLNHLLRKNLQIAPGAYFIKLTAKHSILSSSFTIQ
ncbi:MAG TPA: T9SS type A sorting domain-containing protein, partial [Saprospiraceae bacterium]|nr:T9SS type A sorting domain-containing protein [Saprospiraceae bacterium]